MRLRSSNHFKSVALGITMVGWVSMVGCGVKGPPTPYVTADEMGAESEKKPNGDVKTSSEKAMSSSPKSQPGKP